MMFQISNPLLFLLLGLIPLILLINHGTRVEAARWRRVTTLVLRLGAVLCLILALVGTQQREREDLLSVVFLLDVSDSVPHSQQIEGIERIHTAVDALKPTDAFSVILFAGQASIRLPMQPKAEQGHLTPDILSDTAFNPDATNLAGAIQLAMNIFPEERQKRMVLLSDGVQNVGEASEILDLVRASEIELFTIPLNSERENEVWVRDLQLPPQVRSGETFRVRAIIESAVEAQVTAQLYRNRVLVIPAQTISLKRGKQTVDFPQQLFDEGNYEYQLKFFVTDSISENNIAYGFTRVHGRPHILYVEDEPEDASPLKTVLEANRFAVQVISPSEFPTHPVALQNSDVVVMSNVSADSLSESQMEMIESYVRDLGKGLVAIGGGHAFGMGGYHDTPLERVLPLDMTPRQQKESLALMLVIDASGSMANYVGSDQKIQLAIEGVRAAIRALKDEDQVGVIGFDAKIKMEIPPRTDHASLLHKVGELTPGGGTKMYPALKRAYERLKDVDAKQKHIVLLSDGKSDGDFIPLAKQIAADKITVTAIAIGDAAQELMKAIADAGKGNYTDVQNISQLPRVLANEVRQTQKYMIQEPFQPVISEGGGAILAGIDRLPKLYGYIATSEKEHAEVYLRSPEEHPILAAWNYGLGRAVAFTADVKPGWGADWIAWEKFGKFWGQVVNSVLPSADGGADFDLTVSHLNGRGQVVIERSPSPPTPSPLPSFPSLEGQGWVGEGMRGEVENEETFDVRVARPDGEGESVQLKHVTPTRYEGDFPIREPGVYLITAQEKRGGKIEGPGGTEDSANRNLRRANLVVSYPAEFAEFAVNRGLLSELASRTNGIYEPSPEQIAHHSGKAIERLKPLSGLLLVVSVFLFVLEMFFRRLSLASGYLSELRAQLASLRRRGEGAPSSTLTRLSERKAILARATQTGFTHQQREREAPADAVPTRPAYARERVSSTQAFQPGIGGSTGRLLEAKRRAKAGS